MAKLKSNNWADNSIYGQASAEGGIADMFIDDIKEIDKRTGMKKTLTDNKGRYCPYCGKMQPGG